jgi:hypothetical protein
VRLEEERKRGGEEERNRGSEDRDQIDPEQELRKPPSSFPLFLSASSLTQLDMPQRDH